MSAFMLVQGQRTVKKSIVDHNISLIQIDTENCFKVDIETSTGKELIVEASFDGEYNKDLLLTIKEEGNTLKIQAGFQPNFVDPNDKLSAHKVVSIALKIKLPSEQAVQVFGTNSNIDISGSYKNLTVTLADGHCFLNQVSRYADIKTQSGDIRASIVAAMIKAQSKYGMVKSDKIPFGDAELILTTTTGNIYITKTE